MVRKLWLIKWIIIELAINCYWVTFKKHCNSELSCQCEWRRDFPPNDSDGFLGNGNLCLWFEFRFQFLFRREVLRLLIHANKLINFRVEIVFNLKKSKRCWLILLWSGSFQKNAGNENNISFCVHNLAKICKVLYFLMRRRGGLFAPSFIDDRSMNILKIHYKPILMSVFDHFEKTKLL